MSTLDIEMTEECGYCGCSIVTAVDSYCSCDRSLVYVLDLATPRPAVRQPPPPDFGQLQSSKRSSRAYKSMIAVGETDVVANSAVRNRLTASAEALHRSPAVHHNGHAPPALQEQNSPAEVVQSADRDSCGTDGPRVPDLQATVPQTPGWKATDPRAPDFSSTELQITDQLQEYNFCSTYDPHVANCYANDFFAVITPNASDDFDAVDLTGDDFYRQRSVDFGGWEERAPADSAQARSLENGTWGTCRVQIAGDSQKEKGSLWTRFKKYISRGLCCQPH